MKITDAMLQFASGLAPAQLDQYVSKLSQQWYQHEPGALSTTFSLLYPQVSRGDSEPLSELLQRVIGEGSHLSHCFLEGFSFRGREGDHLSLAFTSATLIECDLSRIDFTGSDFRDVSLASCSLAGASIRAVSFDRAVVEDLDVTDANLQDADFTRVLPGVSIRIGETRLAGDRALGALHSLGARIPDVAEIFKLMNHPLFEIVSKICRKVLEGGQSQVLGLTQRGVSARDTRAALEFVDLLVSIGFVREDRAGAERVVELVRDGRAPMRAFVERADVAPEFVAFFESHRQK